MNNVDIRLLKEIADLEGTPKGAYNIRKNGQLDSRKTTANIDIVTKDGQARHRHPHQARHQAPVRPYPGPADGDRPGRPGLQRLLHRPGLRRGHRRRLRHPQRGVRDLQARRRPHLLCGRKLQGPLCRKALRRGRGHRRAHHEPPDHRLPGKGRVHSAGHHPAARRGLHPAATPRWS